MFEKEKKFYTLMIKSVRHRRAFERAGIKNINEFVIFLDSYCTDTYYCNNVVIILGLLSQTKCFGEKCEAYLWECAKEALS